MMIMTIVMTVIIHDSFIHSCTHTHTHTQTQLTYVDVLQNKFQLKKKLMAYL